MSNLDTQILNLVSLHGPVKARNVAIILAEEFGKHVDRSDVNSALYRMKSDGKVEVNSSFKWSVIGARTQVNKGRTEQKVEASEPVDAPVINATIEFTPEQQAVIDLDPSEHLLIRGQAGSGKTTVLAARAGKIISAMNKGTLLFLTYNSALSAYVKKAFTSAGMKGDIDVRTFHDWAKGCSKELGATFDGWVATKERSEQLKIFINQAIKELGGHRLYELEGTPPLLGWWGEEVAWLFGQHITRLAEYREIERTNRGTSVRVTSEDRSFIWYVFELYVEWLEESRKEDYDNPAGLVLKVLEQQGKDLPESLRYDHVLVDEVQDFDRSWLLAVVKIPRVSLSLAGDLAQKIYRRNFTWKSVGIQVQGGRSRRLAASHRTTLQVMDVAECLLKDNSVVKSDDYSIPVRPKKNGGKVRKLVASSPKVAYERGYDWIADNFKRLKTTSVVVALPFSKQLYPAQKALEKRGLTVKAAKGAGLGNFSGGVVVTTYHQLKGLEFDHVVIMGLHDSQYPGRLIEKVPEEDQNEELEMAKRVLYVAMTRAKQSVTLVGSAPFCRLFEDVPEEYFEIIE
jgi:superfamily I DNA/RNA helicase